MGGFIVDDSLVLELSVTAWEAGPMHVRLLPAAPGSSGSTFAGGEVKQTSSALRDDWSAFLAGGQATDVEVGGGKGDVGEPAVKAHRVVLAARSPVFNRMLLASGMREARDGAKVLLDGADRAVAERFVRFLYTDELDGDSLSNPDVLCHLLALAHRYEVPSLSRACTAHLTITEDTAADRLITAEQFGIPALREQVMDYICSCHKRLALVQKTKAFARMTKNYPELLADILDRVTQPAAKRARMSGGSA